MAVINFFESTITEVSDVKEIEEGSVLKDVVQNYVDNLPNKEFVEVYFPDEDKTEFIPLENDSYDVVCISNGSQVNLTYIVKNTDVLSVFLIQKDNKSGGVATGIGGVGIALVGVLSIVAAVATAGTATVMETAMLVGSGLVGATIGTAMAISGFIAAANAKDAEDSVSAGDNKNLYSINGGSNESIIGKKYPLVLGKHLVNPYIVGSPYHVTFNRVFGDTGDAEDTGFEFNGWKTYSSPSDYDDAKKDHYDDGQFYQALYCVGYGPLKLTDFKIGETLLAYNRPVNSTNIDNLVAKIKSMTSGGSVNMLNRQPISAQVVYDAGWTDIDPGSYATTYTVTYPNGNYSKYINMTPIIMDHLTGEFKRVMSPSEFNSYCQSVYSSCTSKGVCSYDPYYCKVGDTFWASDYSTQIECLMAAEDAAKKIHEYSNNYTRKCMIPSILHGILEGVDEDYDAGNIVAKWKNNDVKLEILQAGDFISGTNKWSSIYPVTVKEDSVDGPILFAYDKDLTSAANVVYKNVSMVSGYRTNSVRFSKSCPYRIEVELDMPSGLYATRTVQSEDSSSAKTYYYTIPIFMAVQWRFASSDEASSNAEKGEGWNTFDYEVLHGSDNTLYKKEPMPYSSSFKENEILWNRGLNKGTGTNYNSGWTGQKVFELSSGSTGDLTTWNRVDISESNLKDLAEAGIITYETVTYKPFSKITTSSDYGKTTHTEWISGANIPYMDCMDSSTTESFYGGTKSSLYVKQFTVYNISLGPNWDGNIYRYNSTQVGFYEEIDAGDTKAYVYRTYTFITSIEEQSADLDQLKYTKDTYNIAERRFVFAKEFTPEECQQLINTKKKETKYLDTIEVRVIRLTPCYLNEANAPSTQVSAMNYEDLVKWTYLRTWTFNKDEYQEAVNNAIDAGTDLTTIKPDDYPERPISKEDLNRFCYIALSLKQDVAETGGSSLEKLNCIATSLQPKYDIIRHKWSPIYNSDTNSYEEISISKKTDYYFINFDSYGVKEYVKLPISAYTTGTNMNPLFKKLELYNCSNWYSAESQYKYGITTDYAQYYFTKDAGNNYYDIIRQQIFDNKLTDFTYPCYPYTHEFLSVDVPTYYLSSEDSVAFETQNTASAAIYSLIGGHLKGDAKDLTCVELNQFADFFEFCNDVTDGSRETYTSPNYTFSTDDKSSWDILVNSSINEAREALNILGNAPVNAVWKGCYDYAIDILMLSCSIPLYKKKSFIKYLESSGNFAPSDGKLHIQFNCNGVITAEKKLETLFYEILLTGRATYRRSDDNKYEPVIARVNPYPVTVINQRNCLSKNNSRSFEETLSGFHVSYIDENDNYETNSFYVMDDGENSAYPTKHVEDFTLNFVTNPSQMKSLARFNLASKLYQREAYTRTVGVIGYSLALGDVVLLQDDSLLIGTDKGGRIEELLIDEATNCIVGFTSNEPFDYTGELDESTNLCKQGCSIVQPSKFANSRCVTVRFATPGKEIIVGTKETVYNELIDYYVYKNGAYELYPVTNQDTLDKGTYYSIKKYSMQVGKTNLVLLENKINRTTEESNDATIDGSYYVYKPEEGNILAFGYVGSITSKAIVMSIKPKDKGQFDLALVPYNDELYNYGEKIPFFKSNMTIPKRDAEEYGFTEYSTSSDEEENNADLLNMVSHITRDMIVGQTVYYAVTTSAECPDVSVDSSTGIPTASTIWKSGEAGRDAAYELYSETMPFLWTAYTILYNNGQYDKSMDGVTCSHWGATGPAGNDFLMDLSHETFTVFTSGEGNVAQDYVTTEVTMYRNSDIIEMNDLLITLNNEDVTRHCIKTPSSEDNRIIELQIPTSLVTTNYDDFIITGIVTVYDSDSTGVKKSRFKRLTITKFYGEQYLNFDLDSNYIKVDSTGLVVTPTKINVRKYWESIAGRFETQDGFMTIETLPNGEKKKLGYEEASLFNSTDIYKTKTVPYGIYGYKDDGTVNVETLCGEMVDGKFCAWVFYNRSGELN